MMALVVGEIWAPNNSTWHQTANFGRRFCHSKAYEAKFDKFLRHGKLPTNCCLIGKGLNPRSVICGKKQEMVLYATRDCQWVSET